MTDTTRRHEQAFHNASDDETRYPLIDVRPFISSPRVLSDLRVVVHLPFAEIRTGGLGCALPPRNIQFCVLCDAGETTEVTEWFARTKYTNNNSTRSPWLVVECFSAADLSVLAERWPDIKFQQNDEIVDDKPYPRLWEPDPLAIVLYNYLKKVSIFYPFSELNNT
jgi:hypothetical protein